MMNDEYFDKLRCPQLVDFNNIDDGEGDSYFDSVWALESRYGKMEGNSSNLPGKKQATFFSFTATPGSSNVSCERKLKRRGMCSNSNKVRQTMTSSVKRRLSHTLVKESLKKPRKLIKPTPSQQKTPSRLALKYPTSLRTSRSVKKAKKITKPKTPACLKRSLKRTKLVKSSEQLELEHMAHLRKQLHERVKRNEINRKRIFAITQSKLVCGSSCDFADSSALDDRKGVRAVTKVCI